MVIRTQGKVIKVGRSDFVTRPKDWVERTGLKPDWAALIAIALQAAALVLGAFLGVLQTSEVSSAIAHSLVGGIFTCAGILIAHSYLQRHEKTEYCDSVQRREEALEYYRENLGVTYVFWSKPDQRPIGFVTLAMGSLRKGDLPAERKGKKPFRHVPSLLSVTSLGTRGTRAKGPDK